MKKRTKKLLLLALVALPAQAQTVVVTGQVAHPGPVALSGPGAAQFSGAFASTKQGEQHSWSGTLLADVLASAQIIDAPGKKTHLRHVIIATGKDGYAVALAIGEIDPKGEAKTVLIATEEDGKKLPLPRLVVPGDTHLARCVRDLTTLDVQ